jgi:hypothetical protein
MHLQTLSQTLDLLMWAADCEGQSTECGFSRLDHGLRSLLQICQTKMPALASPSRSKN